MQCLRNRDNAHCHFWASCFGALRTCTSDRQCLLKDDKGWQIEGGFSHKMNTKNIYAFSWLKHVVLSKSEGPQKWLAPCGTDVHRVARTIGGSILEKDSHRQNKFIMRNEV
jgi:hypothetical protein